jgi:hypothetical protein
VSESCGIDSGFWGTKSIPKPYSDDLRPSVACMAEKVEAFLVAYGSQERANSAPEFRNSALGGLSQERFEFAKGLLDRVETR